MKKRSAPKDAFKTKLRAHAKMKARGLGAQLAILAFGVTALLVAVFVWFESFRYFEPGIKSNLLWLIGTLILLTSAGIVSMYWLLKNQRIKDTQAEQLAGLIGEKLPDVGDRVLNAVQLNSIAPEEGISPVLNSAAVQAGLQVMEQVPAKLLFPLEKIRIYLKRMALGTAFFLLLYLLNFQDTNAAIQRLSQPGEQFDFPLPVGLQLNSEETLMLAGDTLIIQGNIQGREVDQVELIIQTRIDTNAYLLPVVGQQFEFPLNHALYTTTVIARVTNSRRWEPWEYVESAPLNIQVINRPLVQDLTLRIKPPAYTRLPVEVISRDIIDISGYKGSQVSFAGMASKEIESARLHFEKAGSLPISLDKQKFKAGFTLQESDQIWFELIDDEGVANLDPLRYPVYVAPDIPPLIRVLIPGQDVVLGENMTLPTRLALDDDFGFSRVELNYQILHPDYLLEDTTIYTRKIELPRTDLASTEINYQWALDQISIMPEDAIEYWFTVWDNNTVDGPRKASSKKWIARLPSLDEMFEEISRGNEEIKQEQEDILEIVKEIREKVDELAMEVQKDPNLSWEQQQAAGEAIEQVENLKEQLEKVSEQLDEMVTAAEEQQLFSDETLDNYAELQELMEQLITPELRDAMERLQEAMQQDNPGEMEAAMEDFQSAMEEFQKSVERTLEIFKQVEIEQTLDELATRLSDLAERQENLTQDLSENPSAQDAQVEEQIATDFEKALETTEKLEELLDQHESLSSESVQELREQMEAEGIKENLSEASELLQQGQISQSIPPASQASQSLQKSASQASQMQANMQQQMMADVMSEFRSILLKTLRLSQAQESLEQPTASTSRQSSKLREYADSQMGLIQGLQQLAVDLKDLGNITFAVSPAMGRSMGAVQSNMQQAINHLEARDPGKSAQSQAAARTSLNEMARQLANSMEALQQSGESSGFSEYMQQLAQMAGNQQGLNQQTMMQLGAGKQSMMQELARRQMQLREALSQIEQGMGSDSRMLGDLGKIGEEMESVAKNLRSKRPTQKIHEQQERILSRLLDAQRSATTRDFSKKRKSETAKDLLRRNGNGVLPEDFGEARNILYEELIFSLKQDYTREEQALIREYFNQLEEALND